MKTFIFIFIFCISCNVQKTVTENTENAAKKQMTKEECGKKIESLYEEMAESDIDIVATVEEEDLYKIILRVKREDEPLKEIFANKTCSYITDRMQKIDSFQKKIKDDKGFVKCLASKGVRVFGDPKEASTIQQMAPLGIYGAAILMDCGANRANCENLGIKELPTTAVGNQAYPGMKSRDWFETATGCKYGAGEIPVNTTIQQPSMEGSGQMMMPQAPQMNQRPPAQNQPGMQAPAPQIPQQPPVKQ